MTASLALGTDASIQRAMEERMGDSLGDVRIHTGANAAAACESIDARAFTVGTHVAFNSGEYDPSSPEGQHVLAHELAHVRQQTGGAVSMLPQEDVELEVDPDPALEREAEETAQRVMQGGELGIQRMHSTGIHVQRSSAGTGLDRNEGGTLEDRVSAIEQQIAGYARVLNELVERTSSNEGQVDDLTRELQGKMDAPSTEEATLTEGVKETAKVGAGAALTQIPKTLEEAASLIGDIVSNPSQIVQAVREMPNPGELAEFTNYAVQNGAPEILPEIFSVSTTVGAAMIAATLVSTVGTPVIKAMTNGDRDTVETIKSLMGRGGGSARDASQTGNTRFDNT